MAIENEQFEMIMMEVMEKTEKRLHRLDEFAIIAGIVWIIMAMRRSN